MKRTRDEITMEDCDMGGVSMTPPPSSQWASMSPWKSQHVFTKRYRDRSVPIDAMSCLMSAAVTSARIKKHGSISRLFANQNEAQRIRCTVCECAKRWFDPSAMLHCSHCDKQMGDCCRRECHACCNVFCSLCSTLNCDERLDRVFCLSCNEVQHCRD